VNDVNIQKLLDQWNTLLKAGEQTAREEANKNIGGLDGRIKRTSGMPVIFDLDTFESQNNLQTELCREMPQFANLIRSQPEIMDGYAWIRSDFIELYFRHFRLVVEKLRQLTNQTTNV